MDPQPMDKDHDSGDSSKDDNFTEEDPWIRRPTYQDPDGFRQSPTSSVPGDPRPRPDVPVQPGLDQRPQEVVRRDGAGRGWPQGGCDPGTGPSGIDPRNWLPGGFVRGAEGSGGSGTEPRGPGPSGGLARGPGRIEGDAWSGGAGHGGVEAEGGASGGQQTERGLEAELPERDLSETAKAEVRRDADFTRQLNISQPGQREAARVDGSRKDTFVVVSDPQKRSPSSDMPRNPSFTNSAHNEPPPETLSPIEPNNNPLQRNQPCEKSSIEEDHATRKHPEFPCMSPLRSSILEINSQTMISCSPSAMELISGDGAASENDKATPPQPSKPFQGEETTLEAETESDCGMDGTDASKGNPTFQEETFMQQLAQETNSTVGDINDTAVSSHSRQREEGNTTNTEHTNGHQWMTDAGILEETVYEGTVSEFLARFLHDEPYHGCAHRHDETNVAAQKAARCSHARPNRNNDSFGRESARQSHQTPTNSAPSAMTIRGTIQYLSETGELLAEEEFMEGQDPARPRPSASCDPNNEQSHNGEESDCTVNMLMYPICEEEVSQLRNGERTRRRSRPTSDRRHNHRRGRSTIGRSVQRHIQASLRGLNFSLRDYYLRLMTNGRVHRMYRNAGQQGPTGRVSGLPAQREAPSPPSGSQIYVPPMGAATSTRSDQEEGGGSRQATAQPSPSCPGGEATPGVRPASADMIEPGREFPNGSGGEHHCHGENRRIERFMFRVEINVPQGITDILPTPESPPENTPESAADSGILSPEADYQDDYQDDYVDTYQDDFQDDYQDDFQDDYQDDFQDDYQDASGGDQAQQSQAENKEKMMDVDNTEMADPSEEDGAPQR
ncbi:uncharacterized protein LOC124153611 [Ischnura elegans]|uniref:uncharacterized protein LOC124153611 n=1 Tax=Ischnura elegans TaxID=197161 RepID=UPI001ED8B2E4|nr:uncharacterized protein LOC124153611 [Ischnura elegans]